MIIGVADDLVRGKRKLYGVGKDIPSRKQILARVNSVCEPKLQDLHLEFVELDDRKVLVILLPPSPHLYETIKNLTAKNGKVYQEHSVFIRRNEGIGIASTQERKALEEEKQRVYRQYTLKWTTTTSTSEPIREVTALAPLERRNQWLVLLSDGTDYFEQVCLSGRKFPYEEIKRKWSTGFQITSMGYGAGYWAVVMSKGSGYRDQKIYTRSEKFPYYVKEKQKQGYFVTSLAYGRSEWIVVLSKGSGFSKQLRNLRKSFPGTRIREKAKEDFRVTGLAYGGKWAVVLSEGAKKSSGWHWGVKDFPFKWIQEASSDEYRISNLVYGGGKWGVILYKGTGINNQSLYVCEASSLSFFASNPDNEKYITGISFGLV